MPKGKKECPKCKTITGARASSCECGHQFGCATKEKKLALSSTIGNCYTAVSGSISNPVISTPQGRCPYSPKNYSQTEFNPTDEDITNWADKVYNSGNYAPEAVAYWIHEFWDINGPNLAKEYKRVKELVLNHLRGIR